MTQVTGNRGRRGWGQQTACGIVFCLLSGVWIAVQPRQWRKAGTLFFFLSLSPSAFIYCNCCLVLLDSLLPFLRAPPPLHFPRPLTRTHIEGVSSRGGCCRCGRQLKAIKEVIGCRLELHFPPLLSFEGLGAGAE